MLNKLEIGEVRFDYVHKVEEALALSGEERGDALGVAFGD